MQAYFRFESTSFVVHAKDVIKFECQVTNTPDGQNGVIVEKSEFLNEVTETEDRYSVFKQAHLTDRNISQQIFAFKFNACKMLGGQDKRANILLLTLKKGGYKGVTCPFKKGLKYNSGNSIYDDSFFPPMHIEAKGRVHKEVYGRVKGMRKWTKLYTQDTFVTVKK